MRRPFSLECETVEVEGKSLRMFPIGKQEMWFIGMVTGKLTNKRALKRCNIFITLKDRLHSPSAPDSKMATMRFDDEEEVSPVRKNKRSRELDEEDSPNSRRARYFMPTPHKLVRVPEGASSKEERDVWLMSRKGRLWIDEDNLAWIVSWVKDDLESGGIDPIEHDDDKPGSEIWWNFQEDCWVAQRTRDSGVDGQPIQRRGHVERRSKTRGDPCFGLSKEAAKKVVFDELSEWLLKPE